VAVSVALAIYLLLGAAIFQAVESEVQIGKCGKASTNLNRKILIWARQMKKKTNIVRQAKAAQEILDTYRRLMATNARMVVVGNTRTKKLSLNIQCIKKWTFVNSLLFSLVTITTVGYGDTTPKTPIGQMICIIYAIIGIPLLLLFVYYWTRVCNQLSRTHLEGMVVRGCEAQNR